MGLNKYDASTDTKRANFHRLYKKRQFSRERHQEFLKEILFPTIIMIFMMVVTLVVSIKGLDPAYIMGAFLLVLIVLALIKLDGHI